MLVECMNRFKAMDLNQGGKRWLVDSFRECIVEYHRGEYPQEVMRTLLATSSAKLALTEAQRAQVASLCERLEQSTMFTEIDAWVSACAILDGTIKPVPTVTSEVPSF